MIIGSKQILTDFAIINRWIIMKSVKKYLRPCKWYGLLFNQVGLHIDDECHVILVICVSSRVMLIMFWFALNKDVRTMIETRILRYYSLLQTYKS